MEILPSVHTKSSQIDVNITTTSNAYSSAILPTIQEFLQSLSSSSENTLSTKDSSGIEGGREDQSLTINMIIERTGEFSKKQE